MFSRALCVLELSFAWLASEMQTLSTEMQTLGTEMQTLGTEIQTLGQIEVTTSGGNLRIINWA